MPAFKFDNSLPSYTGSPPSASDLKRDFNQANFNASSLTDVLPAAPIQPDGSWGGMDAGPNPLVSSSSNSPEAPLHEDKLKLGFYKYPLDLGTNYRHIMRIFIYKQLKSDLEYPDVVAGDTYRFDKKAGETSGKVNQVSVGGEAAVMGTAKTVSAATGVEVNKTAKTATEGASSAYLGANIDLSRKTKKDPCAYINLFMPDTMTLTDNHKFEPISVTEALGNAGVLEAATQGGAAGRTEGAAKLAGNSIVDAGKMQDLNLYSQGFALNPQLEILYKGSDQRQYSFTFKFAPRNAKEMQELESIIRTLRFHAAPEYSKEMSAQSRYFIPPSEFEIGFYIVDRNGQGLLNNKHIPRMAQSVLTKVDVNYAPQGHYATFVDGAPVEVQLQLDFLETIVLTKADVLLGY